MPEVIQVRTNGEDFYCMPDPLRHSIGNAGRTIKWHHNDGEFKIVFDGGNPFNDELDKKFLSENGWIEEVVNEDHVGIKVYVYSVGPQNSSGPMADPGLIVRP